MRWLPAGGGQALSGVDVWRCHMSMCLLTLHAAGPAERDILCSAAELCGMRHLYFTSGRARATGCVPIMPYSLMPLLAVR